MSKRKIPFTIIETAVIRSEQLTWTEKRLYIVLKTYRRNSPPTRCDPSLKTIQKSSGLSYPYLKRAKKLLVFKGLIKYQPGKGRTKTNKYIFPLEEGTDDEKEGLLAYLKAKKIGKKLTHFKTKKQGQNEPILDPKNGLKNTKKMGRKKPTNKKYLTRKHQQQGQTKKADVVASPSQKKEKRPKPVVNDHDATTSLITELKELGITEDRAVELLATHLYENIEKQLEWLPYRKNIENPAGALIRAVEDNWPEPPRIAEKIEKRRAIQHTILRDAREDLRKRGSYERAKEWSDKLDPDYQKEFREFLKKEGYRGIAEKLSWQESDKYREVYSRPKEELNHDSETKRNSLGKTQRYLRPGC